MIYSILTPCLYICGLRYAVLQGMDELGVSATEHLADGISKLDYKQWQVELVSDVTLIAVSVLRMEHIAVVSSTTCLRCIRHFLTCHAHLSTM